MTAVAWRSIVFLLSWLVLPVQAEPAPALLVVGDSLGAAYGIPRDKGWVSLLQARLEDNGYPHRVINASITGDTTVGGRTRLPTALERHRPAVVLVELGGNDGLRGLPLTSTRDNLLTMVEASRRAGAQVLLLGVRLPANYGAEFRRRFEQVYAEVSEQTGVALVPHLMAGVAETRAGMLADGIHPAAAGQQQMLDNIWPTLVSVLDAEDGN